MPDSHHSDGERVEEQLRDLKFGPRPYTPGQAETIRQAVAERTPLPAPPAGQEEKRWPVRILGRLDKLGTDCELFEISPDEADEYETQTYYPASHPAVLTPEECALLDRMTTVGTDNAETNARFENLLERLADYGKEHHADR